MLRKIFESLAVLSLLVMFLLSTLFPASPFMWLATASPILTLLRIVLITLIATLLITDEFFDNHLHWLLGIFAIVLCVWVAIETYNSNLQILDILSFLAGSVALATEALEPGIGQQQAEQDSWQRIWAEAKHQTLIYALAAYVMTRSIIVNHSNSRRLMIHGGHRPSAI